MHIYNAAIVIVSSRATQNIVALMHMKADAASRIYCCMRKYTSLIDNCRNAALTYFCNYDLNNSNKTIEFRYQDELNLLEKNK